MNDAGDIDSGPNDLQNYPILNRVEPSMTGASIHGSLNSLPNTSFVLEFFYGDTCDDTGYGEGWYPLGCTSVVTDNNGNADFMLTVAISIPQEAFVTATSRNTATGSTSEFSPCFYVFDMNLMVALSSDQLVLAWSSVPPTVEYWIYGAPNDPHFEAGLTPPFAHRLAITTDTQWASSNGIGDPNSNWTYEIVAIGVSGYALCRSNHSGEQDYEWELP